MATSPKPEADPIPRHPGAGTGAPVGMVPGAPVSPAIPARHGPRRAIPASAPVSPAIPGDPGATRIGTDPGEPSPAHPGLPAGIGSALAFPSLYGLPMGHETSPARLDVPGARGIGPYASDPGERGEPSPAIPASARIGTARRVPGDPGERGRLFDLDLAAPRIGSAASRRATARARAALARADRRSALAQRGAVLDARAHDNALSENAGIPDNALAGPFVLARPVLRMSSTLAKTILSQYPIHPTTMKGIQ